MHVVSLWPQEEPDVNGEIETSELHEDPCKMQSLHEIQTEANPSLVISCHILSYSFIIWSHAPPAFLCLFTFAVHDLVDGSGDAGMSLDAVTSPQEVGESQDFVKGNDDDGGSLGAVTFWKEVAKSQGFVDGSDDDGMSLGAVTSPQEVPKSQGFVDGSDDDGGSLGAVTSPQEFDKSQDLVDVSDDACESFDAVTSPHGVDKLGPDGAPQVCRGDLGAMPKVKAKRPAKAKQAAKHKARKVETKTGATAEVSQPSREQARHVPKQAPR